VRQPIGQGHLFKPIGSKNFHVHEVRVAGVLDIVAKCLFHVADVAGMKVRGDRCRSGIENGHPSGTFDNVRPLIGIGMPMHISQAARSNRHSRRGNRLRNKEIGAVGDPHRPALCLPVRLNIAEPKYEGICWLPCRGRNLRRDR
jgi:hypothetical protein